MGCGRRCNVIYWPGERLMWQLRALAVFGRCVPRRRQTLGTWKLAVVAVLRGDRALLLQMRRSPIRHPSKYVVLRVVCASDAFGLSRQYLAFVFSVQSLNYRFWRGVYPLQGRQMPFVVCFTCVAFLAAAAAAAVPEAPRWVMFRVFGFRWCSSSSQPTLPKLMAGRRCRHPVLCLRRTYS